MPDHVPGPSRRLRGWSAPVLGVLVRPSLWPTALVIVAGLVPRRWWARRPWLPVPDRGWVEFRMVTAFGPEAPAPSVRDTVGYLRWAKAWPRVARR